MMISYLNTGISDETQIAVVVWLQCQIYRKKSIFLAFRSMEKTKLLTKNQEILDI